MIYFIIADLVSSWWLCVPLVCCVLVFCFWGWLFVTCVLRFVLVVLCLCSDLWIFACFLRVHFVEFWVCDVLVVVLYWFVVIVGGFVG